MVVTCQVNSAVGAAFQGVIEAAAALALDKIMVADEPVGACYSSLDALAGIVPAVFNGCLQWLFQLCRLFLEYDEPPETVE